MDLEVLETCLPPTVGGLSWEAGVGGWRAGEGLT